MMIVDDLAALEAICRDQKKWGIMSHFILFDTTVHVSDWRDELMAATKGLVDISTPEHFWVANALVKGNNSATIYFLFDTEEEMDDAFENRICGDDNHETHGYAGPFGTIRSVTCSPYGEWQNENS